MPILIRLQSALEKMHQVAFYHEFAFMMIETIKLFKTMFISKSKVWTDIKAAAPR